MGNSFDPEKSMDSNSEPGDVKSLEEIFREQLEARRNREKHLFQQDSCGRTPLFYAAESGIEEEVQEMIFSLSGTGLSPARNSLISIKDNSGLTAADVAEQNGHEEIARLLRAEQARMDYYE